MIRHVTTPAVPEPVPSRYSNCLVANGTIYVSGQHAGAPGGGLLGDGTVLDQARQAMRKVVALVEAAGANASDIVKLTIFLVDMTRFADIGTVRMEFFSAPLPCSSLIGVNALVSPDLLVEIEAIAVMPSTPT